MSSLWNIIAITLTPTLFSGRLVAENQLWVGRVNAWSVKAVRSLNVSFNVLCDRCQAYEVLAFAAFGPAFKTHFSNFLVGSTQAPDRADRAESTSSSDFLGLILT